MNDYAVDIGSGICAMVELQQNVITCIPPQDEPDDHGYASQQKGQPRVMVWLDSQQKNFVVNLKQLPTRRAKCFESFR